MEAAHRLVLLRHAKAEPAGHVVDELRALALAGRRQCAGVGARLREFDLVPERVLVSSAVRTRQTWNLVRQALGTDVPEPEVVVGDEVYEARADDVVRLVRGIDDRVRTLAVVGHEPAMSGTAAALSAADGDPALLAQVRTGLPTAAFAVVHLSSWSGAGAGAGRLVDVVRPAD